MNKQKQVVAIPKSTKLQRLAKRIKEQTGVEVLAQVFSGADQYETLDAGAKAVWVEQAVNRLAQATSHEKCIQILHSCGRECCSQKHSDEVVHLKKESGSLKEFIERLNDKFIVRFALQEDGSIMAEYPKCYCALVKKAAGAFTGTLYCNCSGGYLKKFLEPALGKPINVQVVHSVVSGGPNCRFHITY